MAGPVDIREYVFDYTSDKCNGPSALIPPGRLIAALTLTRVQTLTDATQ